MENKDTLAYVNRYFARKETGSAHRRGTSDEPLNASEVNDGASPVCQSETKPSRHSLNPLQSSGDAHHRASSLLPGLKDLVPLLFYEEFLPKPTSSPRVDLGQHTQVTGLPAKPFLRPKTRRKTTERLPSQTFFPRGSWQILPFASHPSWTKLLQRIPPAPLPPTRCNPKGEMVSWGPPAVLHLISLLSMV